MVDTYDYIQREKKRFIDTIPVFNLEMSNQPEYLEAWPEDIKCAVRCMRTHFFERKLTTTYIRERCHINGNNFSTRFKYYVGRSPKEFIQFHRLKIAARLLTDANLKNMPVAAIAVELGYSGNGTFDHAFKKAYGEPPGNWREENGSST